MKITIEISDSIAQPIDAHLRGQDGAPYKNERGETVIPKRFANGLADWAADCLMANIEALSRDLPGSARPAALKELEDDIKTRLAQMQEMFRPAVTTEPE
jgi:hypothetical protein